jgi:hypothetical protein
LASAARRHHASQTWSPEDPCCDLDGCTQSVSYEKTILVGNEHTPTPLGAGWVPGLAGRFMLRAFGGDDHYAAGRTLGEVLIRLTGSPDGQMRCLPGGDRITNADLAVGQDVGIEPAAVDEILDDPRPRQLLQMQARLAQLDAGTLDTPDPEPPAD